PTVTTTNTSSATKSYYSHATTPSGQTSPATSRTTLSCSESKSSFPPPTLKPPTQPSTNTNRRTWKSKATSTTQTRAGSAAKSLSSNATTTATAMGASTSTTYSGHTSTATVTSVATKSRHCATKQTSWSPTHRFPFSVTSWIGSLTATSCFP